MIFDSEEKQDLALAVNSLVHKITIRFMNLDFICGVKKEAVPTVNHKSFVKLRF